MKTKPEAVALLAAEWKGYFTEADVAVDKLNDARSEKRKNMIIGNFLSPLVGREVPVVVGGRRARARLRALHGRSRTKKYYFEVTWEDGTNAESPQPVSEPKPDPEPRKRPGSRKRGPGGVKGKKQRNPRGSKQ